jgi:kynureninase
LKSIMPKVISFENTLKFARQMDREDPIKNFRKQFHIPKVNGQTSIYLVGNSLGLQPKSVKKYLIEEMDDWANLGVEGHLHARRPWVYYHRFAKKVLARLAGAKPSEVVAMNQLTVNLHLMMVSFFRPTKTRYKILTEAGAFSSDQYAFESQLRFHNLEPEKSLLELRPREGEHTLRTEDILSAIKQHADEIALVIFGGVQYYTGQFFDIPRITKAGHEAGAIVGFDLAHAIGNTVLNLHNDEVDFAVWCSYKYLNSGPGGIAGAFVHQKHGQAKAIPRFTGWWGHHEQERFQMKKGFIPMPGVDGWQLSNVPVFQAAAHLASLEIFAEAGIRNLRNKSVLLTGYLEYILQKADPSHDKYSILTPSDPKERGCQISIYIRHNGRKLFRKLVRRGIFADWREPDVIRVAPVPLYNTFEDVFKFGEILKSELR